MDNVAIQHLREILREFGFKIVLEQLEICGEEIMLEMAKDEDAFANREYRKLVALLDLLHNVQQTTHVTAADYVIKRWREMEGK